MITLPFKFYFHVLRHKVLVDWSAAEVQHIIDEINLRFQSFHLCALQKPINVTNRETNKKVHGSDGEEENIYENEKVSCSCKNE